MQKSFVDEPIESIESKYPQNFDIVDSINQSDTRTSNMFICSARQRTSESDNVMIDSKKHINDD